MPPRRPLKPISGNIERRKELSPFQRGQIIALSQIRGTPHEISKVLEIPRRTIRDTILRNPQREDGNSKPRSGRPTLLTKHDIRHIIALIKEEPFIPYRIIRQRMQLTCSPRTIYSGLLNSGYGHWLARKRPRLEPEHARKRYEFALQHKDWDWAEWKRVIFLDECSIELGSGKQGVWVFRINCADEKWKKDFIQPLKKGKGV